MEGERCTARQLAELAEQRGRGQDSPGSIVAPMSPTRRAPDAGGSEAEPGVAPHGARGDSACVLATLSDCGTPTPLRKGNLRERLRALSDCGTPSPLHKGNLRERLRASISSVSPGRGTKRPAEPTDANERPSRSRPKKPPWVEQEVDVTAGPPQSSAWEPPVSPFGLIEEQLFHDPWKVLLACLLLNRTSAKQVRVVWPHLMALVPDAQSAVGADPEVLEALLRPLGFHRFRAQAIVDMSTDFLGPWTRPSQLRFVGKYASDAYFIFCRGQWQQVVPDDKDLKRYHAWLVEHGGVGVGLQRDELL